MFKPKATTITIERPKPSTLKEWDEKQLGRWKDFWTSVMGKEALAKMETLRQQNLDFAQTQTTNEQIAQYVNRAAGIGLVIADIQAGIAMYDATKKDQKEVEVVNKL